MSRRCRHNKLDFIGVLFHLDYPEKCFRCSSCGMLITDYLTNGEVTHYKSGNMPDLALFI